MTEEKKHSHRDLLVRLARAMAGLGGLAMAFHGQGLLLGPNPAQGVLWLIPGALLAALAAPLPRRTEGDRLQDGRVGRWYAILLAIIVVTGLLARLHAIDNFAQQQCFSRDVLNDEPMKGIWAMDFLKGRPYTPFIQHWGERETLYIYVECLTILLLGQNLIALKTVSLLCGLGTILLLAGIGRRLVDPRVGLAAAALFAYLPWPMNMNRVAERFNSATLFAALAIYLLIRALDERRWWRFLLAGAGAGLGLYTFPTYRVIPVILAIYALIRLGAGPRRGRLVVGLVLAAVMAAAVALAPLEFSLDSFREHFLQAGAHSFKMARTPEEVRQFIRLNLTLYNHRSPGDMAFSPLGPILPFAVAPLLVIGLGACLLRLHQSRFMLLLLWMVVGSLPGVVSMPAPRRLTAVLPAVVLLAALGAVLPVRGLTALLGRFRRRGEGLILLVAGTALLPYGFHDLYFRTYPVHQTPICSSYEMMRFVDVMGRSFDVFGDHFGDMLYILRFRHHSDPVDTNDYDAQFGDLGDRVPLRAVPRRDVYYVVSSKESSRRALELIPAYYPGVRLVPHRTPDGQLMFTSAFVSRDQVLTRQGLRAVVSRSGLERVVEPCPLGSDPRLQEGGAPDRIHWEGGLVAPRAGVYDFKARGYPGLILRIDGHPVGEALQHGQPVRIFLTRGNHELQAETTGPPSDSAALTWLVPQLPGGEHPIPSWALFPPPVPEDLLRARPLAPGRITYRRDASFRLGEPFPGWHPHHLEIDPDGMLLLLDQDRSRVGRFRPDGHLLDWFDPIQPDLERQDRPGPAPAPVFANLEMEALTDGSLAILDISAQRLRRISPELRPGPWRRLPVGTVRGLAASPDGGLVVSGTREAVLLDREDQPVRRFGRGLLVDAEVVEVDSDRDRVFIHDHVLQRMTVFDLRGEPVAQWENLGEAPVPSLLATPEVPLFFAWVHAQTVYAMDENGVVLRDPRDESRSNLLGSREITQPVDLARGADGSLFVLNHSGELLRFRPDGAS